MLAGHYRSIEGVHKHKEVVDKQPPWRSTRYSFTNRVVLPTLVKLLHMRPQKCPTCDYKRACRTPHEYGLPTNIKGYAPKDTPDDSNTMLSSVVTARTTEAIYMTEPSPRAIEFETRHSDRMAQSTSAPTAQRHHDIIGIRDYCLWLLCDHAWHFSWGYSSHKFSHVDSLNYGSPKGKVRMNKPEGNIRMEPTARLSFLTRQKEKDP